MMCKRSAPILAFAALLASCAAQAPMMTADQSAARVAYTLAPGDKLRVTVFNEPTLSGEFTVTGDGAISFPLIGNVAVRGKTVEEAQALLRTRLAGGYVNDPRVTTEVLNYRPYYILGEVGKPGEYPFAVGLTMPQAIAVAGGFTYRANQRRVFVKRGDDPVERQVDIRASTAYVLPGDTIRVGERYF